MLMKNKVEKSYMKENCIHVLVVLYGQCKNIKDIPEFERVYGAQLGYITHTIEKVELMFI